MNEKFVRRVFRDWRSTKALGQNALAGLPSVEAHRVEAGLANNDIGKGIALQKVIQNAIETLKPESGSPNPQDRKWRAYLILTEQFLHARSPEAVRGQLFISRGAYYGEQKKALEMLIAALQEQEMRTGRPFETPGLHRQNAAPFLAPPRAGRRIVGRENDLQQIKNALFQEIEWNTMALHGLPGVGKTTLAIELAYDPEVRRHFEDGVLWAGLGYRPLSPLTLLGSWADTLGIPAHSAASRTDLIEMAGLIHTTIGERRMLIIIDDAWQDEAALALKVGGPNCTHLVTTRLPDVAVSFASRGVIQIHELDCENGLSLLEEVAPNAVASDRDQAQHLVQAVGGLPLALILMGKYLQRQSHGSQPRRLNDAIRSLQTGEARLQLNQLNSPLENNPNFPFSAPLSLKAAIDLSDAALDPAAHQALLDLSLFPPKPSSFSEEAALAAAAVSPSVLDGLVDGGLLETAAPGRYTLHQTITDYAALQGASEPASKRLVDYFLEFVTTNAQKFTVLEHEITNIFSVLELAMQHCQHTVFIQMILALYPFLETRGLYALAERYLKSATTAAQELDDPGNQAATLSKLGDFEVRRGQFKNGQVLLEQGLALARAIDNRQIESDILFNLGLACAYRGEMMAGQHHLEKCIAIYRELNNRTGEAYALNALGFTLEEMSRYKEAIRLLEAALELSLEVEERRIRGWTHYNFGEVCLCLGEYDQAKDHDERCLKLYRDLGDRRGEGWIIFEQGRAFRQTGDYSRANDLFSQALHILGGLGDTMGAGYAILNLGLIQMDLGHPDAAEAHYREAIQKFTQIDCQIGESQALHFLASLYRRNGDLPGAKALLEKSLVMYGINPNRRGECTHLANLALVESYLGCNEKALELANRALRITVEIQAAPMRAYVLIHLGKIMLNLSNFDAAEPVFREALSIYRQLAQNHLVVEPLAGLAELAFRKGDFTQALARVDEVLSTLGKPYSDLSEPLGFPPRLEWPGHVYLMCFKILAANQDPRAETVLNSGKRYLEHWAARLSSPDQRSLFLAIPEHREILDQANP